VFAKDLEELCGLSVHPYIIEDWAPRMAIQGLLLPHESEVVGGRSFTSYVCADPDIPDVADLETRIVRLFDAFEAYAGVLFKLNSLAAPPREILERELVKRIQSMGFDNIQAKPERPNGSTTALTLERRAQEPDPETHAAQLMDVACATFFIELKKRESEQFELVTDLAAGALGAEVVLSFRVPPKTGASFKGMRVFLDSPLILDLFDVGGQAEREFARYLLDALKKEGAVVATYEHNVGEIVDVLTAAVQNFERKVAVSGQIGARMRTDNNTVIRAKSILGNPLKRVRDLGIDVADAKAIDRSYMPTFDEAAETDLLGKIRPFQGAISARAVDAASVASIIRYLYGRRPKGGLMAHERMFVTKNTGLVRAAISYIHRLAGLEVADVPILTDRSMAGTLWVASGGKGSELPLHKLLANCTAAVRPRRDVIDKVVGILRNSSPDDVKLFEAMIEDERCGYCLMQSTLGDASLVTDDTTPRLLRDMRRATAAEVIQEKDAELRSLREELEKRLEESETERQAQATTAEQKLDEATESLTRAETELRQQKALYEGLERRLADAEESQRSDRETRAQAAFHRSRFAEWIAYSAVFVPIGLVLYLLSDLSGKLEGWSWVAGLGTSLVLGLAQFAVFPNVLFGKIARNIRMKAFKRELARVGLPQYQSAQIDWEKGLVVFDQTHLVLGAAAKSPSEEIRIP
jgi:hypothetical protein